MKMFVLALAVATLAACGVANNKNGTESVTKDAPASVDFAGKKYCRMVATGGLFGQPAGQREHCIKFIDGQKVSDNGSTFFGNPPEQGTYAVSGQVVTLTLMSVTGSYNETYTLSADAKSITGTAGAVLNLKN